MYIFNYILLLFGPLNLIISVITTCLGLTYRSARTLIDKLPSYLFWVIIVFRAFHFAIWIPVTPTQHKKW